MNNKGWLVLERKQLLDRSPWLKVYSDKVMLEDGETVIPEFYVLEEPPYAMVFTVTESDHALLIEQYKHGVGSHILEVPAGYLDPGEDPLEAAKRELLEETGYTSTQWEFLGKFTKDGNRGGHQGYLFLAKEARQIAEPDSGDLQQQTLHLMSLERVRELWLNGGFNTFDMMALVGIALDRLTTEQKST